MYLQTSVRVMYIIITLNLSNQYNMDKTLANAKKKKTHLASSSKKVGGAKEVQQEGERNSDEGMQKS